MKNKLFLALMLIISLIIYQNSYSQGFHSVFTANGNAVWAVGNNGTVFYSANGGNTWASYLIGSVKHKSVHAVNQCVWIVGESGGLQVSINGGSSWTPYTISSSNLNSVYFIDESTGWAVGNSGSIFKSTNGGINWESQPSPVSENLNSIKMISATNGAACGDNGSILLYNGSVWTQSALPTNNNFLSIDKKSSTIIATASDGFIVKSTNNGLSWVIIDYKMISKSEVYSVFMFDENSFYTCGGGGFIRKSVDGGSTFIFQENPMMANLVDIYFYNNNTGWAVSSLNNAIIRTTNGGTSWELPAGTTVNYSWSLKQFGTGNIGHGFCPHPFNKNTIFIAMGNKVYRSLNKGDTWQEVATISPGYRAHTFFISKLDSNLWIASMDESSGRVVRSTNYGQTWTVTWGPGVLTNYGMPMMDDWTEPNRVYLNPDYSRLFKSTDYGLTWNPVGTKVFRSPDNITVAYNNPDVIFSGDGVTGSGVGELFKTTNGGLNWSLVHTVSGSEIPFTVVSSLDSNLSYHTCWSSGGVWKSSDLWNTFTQVATTGGAWAADISKDDPTAFAYGVYGSAVYVSTNSGINYVQVNVGSSPEAGMYFHDRGTLLSQKGNGVYKFNVNYTVITSANLITTNIPEAFSISQNYPNPFNPVTKFLVNIPSASHTKIIVYDVLGNEVERLIDQMMTAGTHEVTFDGKHHSSGIYFYKIFNEKFTQSRKMILLK
jgi:photosystem II stability/assembly factor-like uncharacterized protein